MNRDIAPLTLQCDDARDQYSDGILLRAIISTSSRTEPLLNSLKLWITGAYPYVTVSNLGIQLRLDHSCPLHTNSLTSNECLDLITPPASTSSNVVTGGSNGGAVAGALIGGILLGVILAVGVGSVILLLLWWRRRGGDKKAQMMKKIDPTTTLAQRYVPSTENLHQESTEAGYEPIGVYIKEGSRDHRAANAYDMQAGEQEAMKQKKQKKSSNKNSGKKVMEDESGYVVPDVLWEGKQRPVAPGSAVSAEKTESNNTPSAPKTTTEYDVPEGIEHRDANKVKGQREPQSAQHVPTNTLSQKQPQQILTGKDHQKQKLQAKEPPKTMSRPTEQSQKNELKKSAVAQQGDKPTKKNKPILHQKKENSSKLAAQYQSDTSPSLSRFGKSGEAAPTSLTAASAQQDHTAVKSKLQNLLTPAASSQPTTTTKPTHTKLSKQPGPAASATENSSAKLQHQHQPQQRQQQESQQASKVMAMAQKLQGAVGQASTKGGTETTDSKSPGTKKKYVLH